MFEKQDAKNYINIYNLALFLASGYYVKTIAFVGDRKNPVLFLFNNTQKKICPLELFAEKTSRATLLLSVSALKEVYESIAQNSKDGMSFSRSTQETLKDMLFAQGFLPPMFNDLTEQDKARYLKDIVANPEVENYLLTDLNSRIQNGAYQFFTEKYLKKINDPEHQDIIYQSRRLSSVTSIGRAAEGLAKETSDFSEKKEIVQQWKNISDAVEEILLGQSLSLAQQQEDSMVQRPAA